MRLLAGLLLALLPTLPCAQTVSSPDGKLVFEFKLTAAGEPQYAVRFDGRPLIEPSRLGIDVEDGEDYAAGFSLKQIGRDSRDLEWEQPWGERRRVRDRANEASFRLVSDTRELLLYCRVYDDGVAFRYELPAVGADSSIRIRNELTEFRLAETGTAFWQTGAGELNYEHLYQSTAIGDVDMAHTPFTLVTDSGVHLSIHEAALVDYSAFRLERIAPGAFRTMLRPWSDGVAVYSDLPLQSPWRTIQVSAQATGLLNSDLILNLNEANLLGDVSWIRPGKYAGIWWEMHRGIGTWGVGPKHAATTTAAKRKIDFASRNGFDGVLIEGWNLGWDADWVAKPTLNYLKPAPDFDLAAVSSYALQNDVRIVGHHETGGHVSAYERHMADALRLMAEHGVAQVKTGYVGTTGTLKRLDEQGEQHFEHRDGQFAVRHHLNNVREAARHKISINTHEPVKDTGLRRSYPNWLSREGARGQEFNVWGAAPNPPEHEVLLAYTRLLAGPMDYTPGIFDLEFEVGGKPRRVQSTLARQLALYVTIYSPIQMVPDFEENYARYPDAFQFIVDVPTDWEESVALAGIVGDYVVFARRERGGNDWYLGAITDEVSRSLQVALDFLPADTHYEATLYRDGEDADWDTDPYSIEIVRQTVTNKNRLELWLAAGGGTAIRFKALQ